MPSGRTGNAPRAPRKDAPPPGGALAKPLGAIQQAEAPIRRDEHVMMSADMLALIGGTDGKADYERFRTWVVAQSVRNALQTFHGGCAFDPDDPGSGAGFISDSQMRVLNITIRRAVHEALGRVDLARQAIQHWQCRELRAEEQEALDFCGFQLGTVHGYMEPPGSPELEEAYQRYVSEPDVNR
jgi:hypothetical protein